MRMMRKRMKKCPFPTLQRRLRQDRVESGITSTTRFDEISTDGVSWNSKTTGVDWLPNDYTAGGINLPNGTTGNNIAMDTNGVYLPDGNFNDFIGCPVNGNWTITVQDNQGIDDGYIFQWGLYFNSLFYNSMRDYNKNCHYY